MASPGQKVVLITGCSSGIGLRMAVMLAKDEQKRYHGECTCVCQCVRVCDTEKICVFIPVDKIMMPKYIVSSIFHNYRSY